MSTADIVAWIMLFVLAASAIAIFFRKVLLRQIAILNYISPYWTVRGPRLAQSGPSEPER